MKIKDFIEKVDDLYLGDSMETHVICNYFETMPRWIGTARYTFKDENGQDIILKRNDDRSYYTDTVTFNVMACFSMMGDDPSDWYHWLSNMMRYLKKSMDDGEMTEDDELYIMLGQSVEENNLFEISDIVYSHDRMGDFIEIETRSVDIKEAVRNIKDETRRQKWLAENGLVGN